MSITVIDLLSRMNNKKDYKLRMFMMFDGVSYDTQEEFIRVFGHVIVAKWEIENNNTMNIYAGMKSM